MEEIIKKYEFSQEDYFKRILKESEEEINNPNTKFLTHEEVFEQARGIISGEK